MAGQLVGDLILRNRHFLDQFSDGLTSNIIKELKKAQEDILKVLASKPDLNKITKGHLRAVLAETTSTLKLAYSDIEEITLTGMEQIAQLEYHSISNAIRSEAGLKKIKASAPNMGLPEKALKNILSNPIGGYFLSDWVGKMKNDHQFAIKSALTQGLIRGSGMDVVARNIRKATNLSMVQARTLARTSIMDASNRALEETYKELSNYISGYKWLATLDSVTCEECAMMDGIRHKNYEDFSMVPLAHPQCRCVISPVTEFEDEEVERPAKVWDEEKKKFVYQKVSSKEKYGDWFDRQDDKFKKDYLGPGRFKLYKDNDLKFKDFTSTRDGRTVLTTIKDLQEKYETVSKSTKSFIGWKNENSVSEAKNSFKNILNVKSVSEANLDLLNQTGKEISYIQEKFPKLKKIPLNRLNIIDKSYLYEYKGGEVLGENHKDKKIIDIAGRLSMERQLKLTGARDWTVCGNSYYGTLRHELGHHYYWQKLNNNQKEEWSNFFFKNCGKDGSFWRNKISKYSVYNEKECFAECFAAVSSPLYGDPKYGKLPKDVEDLIIKFLT